MCFRGVQILAAVLSFGALSASALAQSASMPLAATTKKMAYTATLTLTQQSTSNAACNIGYSSTCGSGNCSCATYTGTGSGSIFGKSSSVSLALTADKGAKTTGNSCFPAFGSLSIEGSKDTETLDIAATVCQTVDGGLQIAGGFQFEELSTRSLEAVGVVTVSAKDAEATKFQMKLKGSAVPGAFQL